MIKHFVKCNNSISHSKRSSMILLTILILLTLEVVNAQYSDLPPPPVKPERFTSKQQLKEYLVKLHEYYAIIGRPRFGRSSPTTNLNNNNKKETLLEQVIRLDKQQQQPIYIHDKPNSNENNNNNNNFLMSILAPNEANLNAKDFLLVDEKLNKNSIPTVSLLDFLDENNDGETSGNELQNFLNYFFKEICNNINNNNKNSLKYE
jgi:hypothetical protein